MRANVLNLVLVLISAIVTNTAHAADLAVGCYRIDDDKKRANGSIELTDKAATGNPLYQPGEKLAIVRPLGVPWKYGA